MPPAPAGSRPAGGCRSRAPSTPRLAVSAAWARAPVPLRHGKGLFYFNRRPGGQRGFLHRILSRRPAGAAPRPAASPPRKTAMVEGPAPSSGLRRAAEGAEGRAGERRGDATEGAPRVGSERELRGPGGERAPAAGAAASTGEELPQLSGLHASSCPPAAAERFQARPRRGDETPAPGLGGKIRSRVGGMGRAQVKMGLRSSWSNKVFSAWEPPLAASRQLLSEVRRPAKKHSVSCDLDLFSLPFPHLVLQAFILYRLVFLNHLGSRGREASVAPAACQLLKKVLTAECGKAPRCAVCATWSPRPWDSLALLWPAECS